MVQKKIKEYRGAVIIGLVGSVGLTYLQCTSCQSDFTRFFNYSFFSFLNCVLLWTINSELNDFLSRHISWIKTPIKRLIAGILATVVCTVLGVLVIVKIFELAFNFHFTDYVDVIIPSLVITFFISLFFHGRGFLLAWQQAAISAEHFQQQSIEAQYQSLKNQVNPHFLFNSLNALTNLVYEDQDKAAKFIKQLSEVYRYVLDTRDKEIVPLSEELKFIESYLFLQQIRFGDKLKVKIILGELQTKVAPLAIQMLIENAIKHNEISEENPLTIRIYEEAGFIVVENNLQRKKVLDEESGGLGLENICKRYEFLSDKKVEVSELNSKFRVAIPILASDE
jgi:sensor histidine kinase YesM